MCILCVVQKWSRRVATMLPWLVIPLIGLWALSQLLPPGFRVEVTSPRLACVLVLLVTLLWYEVLMPQLSSWRSRRTARLKELRRSEALELQKLRKTATRRCRNCLTPYRDQNPGCGRFMCCYCGHVSKRPVLDMPGPGGWICGGPDWSESGSWVLPKPGYLVFSGDDKCSAEESYSGAVVFVCRLSGSFFSIVQWLWRKAFWLGPAQDRDKSGVGSASSRKGENGGNLNESRGEKARRKAEEKRQARLERELLEEEERNQKEEVARLVEERRRLREEQTGATKDQGAHDKDRESRRETRRKQRQERKKDKDKGSSKSNSDVEDPERKGSSRESERKREIERLATQCSEKGNGVIKGPTMNGFSRASGGSRYFDHVKGSFLSSSKAFNGAGFFGHGVYNSAASGMKVNKAPAFRDVLPFGNRKEAHSTEHIMGKFTSNGDDNITKTACNRPVGSDLQPQPTVLKKSWQQLFTRSSAVFPCSDVNPVSQLDQNHQLEFRNSHLPDCAPSTYHLDNPMQFGLPSPFVVSTPLPNNSMSSSSLSAAESIFRLVGEQPRDFPSDEAELFEDPCYVPDPLSLLGPVSESLNNFSLDIGTGSVTNMGLERPHVLKNVSASAEVHRPSPIESPISRLRVAEERHVTSGRLPCTPKSPDPYTLPLAELSNAHEQGAWQMWGSPPLGQDGLGLLGGPASWLLPLGQNKTNQEDVIHPSQNDLTFDSHSSAGHPLELSPANCWTNKDWVAHGQGGSVGNSTLSRPHAGGLFSTSDVESLWSFS
ncbi:uncharacterized protein LOC131223912 isoform X1 [Magnolia sinica]|uniref:uncharacterized protein LOC131223912 isoform X1 n=1 Tax=Magnolia sinica TaxID=86752 RepID=UPI002659EA6F|nr:uncharacterized protein LOC131223912 isoform X1 [Magnolia sinica]